MGKDINRMHPDLKTKFILFKQKMDEKNITFQITSIDRNILEQMALYVQGRLDLKSVNRFRKAAGLYLFTNEIENKNEVTWTLESKHVVNHLDSLKENDLSRAFDIVITKDNRANWNLKVDVNNNKIPDYDEAGIIGESVGLKWGGRFSKPDRPHFEI